MFLYIIPVHPVSAVYPGGIQILRILWLIKFTGSTLLGTLLIDSVIATAKVVRTQTEDKTTEDKTIEIQVFQGFPCSGAPVLKEKLYHQ